MKTNQKIAAALFAAMMGVTAVGMTQASAAAKPVKPVTSVKSVTTTPTTTDKMVDVVKVTDPTKISKLNHTSVPALVQEAEARYVYAMNGGKGDGETFKLNGKEYRYLSSDIGTKEKLYSYLTEIYTKQAADFFLKKNVIVHNGRMAQLNVKFNNTLDFTKTTARMLNMTATQRVYNMYVPYDDAKKGRDKVVIKFNLVGDYWRVGSAPHVVFQK